MKIYIAARYERRKWVTDTILPVVLSTGHECTSSWLSDYFTDLPERSLREEVYASRIKALVDLHDVARSDYILLVSEQYKSLPELSPSPTGGRHFETGYACAKGIPLILLGPVEGVFHQIDGVDHVGDVAYLRALLLTERFSNANWPRRTKA